MVITLEDIWVLPMNFAAKLQQAGVKTWISWLPVDGTPAPPSVIERARTASVAAVYSKFGERELCEAGVSNARYVPLGADCSIYRPLDRQAVRRKHLVPDGAFVVTMVAANKGWPCRKSFPEAIEAFGRFHRRHPEAVLYLHTEGKGEGVGLDLSLLIDQLGIPGEAVKFVNQTDYMLGLSTEHMAEIYNVSDVLLAPSMGEGFGLPIVEAQAAGCPVLTQDCTSMSELTVNGVLIQPLQRFYTPLGHWQYLASVDEIDQGLETIYRRPAHERERGKLAGVAYMRQTFDWPVVVEQFWRPLLEEAEARVEAA